MCVKLYCRIGVLPLGAQVRTRCGRSLTPGWIYEDDGSALFGAVFFSVGHRFVFHWRMACSSRLMARPLGRWQEKFSPLSSRHTPDFEYRLPLIFSMSLVC